MNWGRFHMGAHSSSMTSQKHTKINQLLRRWPEGSVGTLGWLKRQGVSAKLADWYVRSGWLDRIGSGAFVRGGDKPDWTGGVYALQQQLGMALHVGARTALELQGRAHFVPLGRKHIMLISDRPERLPAWFRRHDWSVTVTHRRVTLFVSPPDESLVPMSCGRYEVLLSTPERAIMEVIHLARKNFEIEHAHELVSGLAMLRPGVVQPLLESCTSAKVKRFFLWSAEQRQHAWFTRLDLSAINLGKGRRQLYKGGQFSSKYGITVPRSAELPDV